MDEPSEDTARKILHSDDEVVVEPWEERAEVVEAGLDDNTAPLPEAADD
jgi:hypothetical protein